MTRFTSKFPNVKLVWLRAAIDSADEKTLELLALSFGYGRCPEHLRRDVNEAFDAESHFIFSQTKELSR